MPENVIYALSVGWIPFVFIVVGLLTVIKAAQNIYRNSNGRIKVMARCVEIQQIQEEETVLYRPVFEYGYKGRLIRASKVDYEYENCIAVGTVIPLYVDKKHMDVICENTNNIASEIVKLVMGIFILFSALPFVIPVFIMLFLNQIPFFAG